MKTASAAGAASAVTSARVVVVAVVALVLVWKQQSRPTTSAEVARFAAVTLGPGWGEAVRTDADCPAVAWCMCSCADASLPVRHPSLRQPGRGSSCRARR